MNNPYPNWLEQLRTDLDRITGAAATALWPGPSEDHGPYFNYRLEHVKQVERDALGLHREVGGDLDILLASVWIHDRFQPQYHGENHAARAAEWTAEHLPSYGFPRSKVDAVHFVVANHSNPPRTIPKSAHEARLLWDADKLSKLGAVSILAHLCAIPAFPHNKVSYHDLALAGLANLGKMGTWVDDFYFNTSHTWARERYHAQKAFFEALGREVGLS